MWSHFLVAFGTCFKHHLADLAAAGTILRPHRQEPAMPSQSTVERLNLAIAAQHLSVLGLLARRSRGAVTEPEAAGDRRRGGGV